MSICAVLLMVSGCYAGSLYTSECIPVRKSPESREKKILTVVGEAGGCLFFYFIFFCYPFLMLTKCWDFCKTIAVLADEMVK